MRHPFIDQAVFVFLGPFHEFLAPFLLELLLDFVQLGNVGAVRGPNERVDRALDVLGALLFRGDQAGAFVQEVANQLQDAVRLNGGVFPGLVWCGGGWGWSDLLGICPAGRVPSCPLLNHFLLVARRGGGWRIRGEHKRGQGHTDIWRVSLPDDTLHFDRGLLVLALGQQARHLALGGPVCVGIEE